MRKTLHRILALSLAVALSAGCAATSGTDAPTATKSASADHPEARPFDPSLDAIAAIEAAYDRTAKSGKLVMVVMGANWCHDSRAFAGWLETPRFASLVEQHYEVIYVNVGMPQTGDGFNTDIAKWLGYEAPEGTPNVYILNRWGQPLNLDTAATWRNAASRSEEEIYDELAGFIEPEN